MSKSYCYHNFTLQCGDPVLILKGEPYEKVGWGPYQFPKLNKTRDGKVLYTCTPPSGKDNVLGYEAEAIPFGRVSSDNGETWQPLTDKDLPVGIPLNNGHEFYPPNPKNSYTVSWLDRYEPVVHVQKTDETHWSSARYYAENIPEYDVRPVAYDYDPETRETTAFRESIHWPHLSMNVLRRIDGNRYVYAMDTLMGMMGHTTPLPNGSLLFATYQSGFSAQTGEPTFKYSVKVLRSDDNGRTWDYQSEFLYSPEYAEGQTRFEGFCEPFIEVMGDGSLIILMRSGWHCPSYIARSTDEGKTWSKPVLFDQCGVFPQLLRLSNGITLASYGRPGVYLRATSDEQGLVWENPIDLGIAKDDKASCSYTNLLALDDHTALLAYADFRYPLEDGTTVKALLVRKVTIKTID